MTNEFKEFIKEAEEPGSMNFDFAVALLVICVIACCVGFAWKRKQNSKPAQKEFDGAMVMQEQRHSDIYAQGEG